MGSPTAELGRDPDEPETEVTLTHGLAVAETEVTQESFLALLGWNPSQFNACGVSCPVDSATWFDSLAYANKRSLADGYPPCYVLGDIVCGNGAAAGSNSDACYPANGGIISATVSFNGVAAPADCVGYRLPSEAEWEYAARAGVAAATYNGELAASQSACPVPGSILDSIAWFCDNAGLTTHPVRGKQPNPWGLYDVLGNVWEWVWDRYETYPPGPLVDPVGPQSGAAYASRGGSYISRPFTVRLASRSSTGPDDRQPFRGLRIVRTIE